MLNEIFTAYNQVALGIDNFNNLSKEDLVTMYVENCSNDNLANIYMAGIVVKYWYLLGTIKRKNNGIIADDDCYNIVIDGIMKALQYTPWLVEGNKLYQSETGINAAISGCVETRRKAYFAYMNLDKRKLNNNYYSESLDKMQEDQGDYSTNLISDFSHDEKPYNCIDDIIFSRINKNDIFGAIVLDLICYDECSIKTSRNGYSERELVRLLHHIDSAYIKYFMNKYNVSLNKTMMAVKEIENYNFKILHSKIHQLLYSIKVQFSLGGDE